MAYDEEHGVSTNREVGGVHVEIYDDGHIGIDEQRLVGDIHHKVNNTISRSVWGCVFSICFTVAFIALVIGSGWYVWHMVTTNGGLPSEGFSNELAVKTAASKWSGDEKLICAGNDKLNVDGVTAKLAGTVVEASGNCRLTIKNSKLTGDVAISASSNASVTVEGGNLTGKTAIETSGNAKVHLIGVAVSGEKKSGGLSKITSK